MGYYINRDSKGNLLPDSGKAEALLNDGATATDSIFKENLICVVENMLFDAAGYCFSQQERDAFAEPDGRLKKWLIHPMAKELSGYQNHK